LFTFIHTVLHVGLLQHVNTRLMYVLFLPRDAMRKRGLYRRPVSVRLSVCPSRWWIVSTWLKISSNFILDPVAPSFYFLIPALVPNSKGKPFSGGTKYTGWENFRFFDWNRRLSRKRYEIGSWLLWNHERIIAIGNRSDGSMRVGFP